MGFADFLAGLSPGTAAGQAVKAGIGAVVDGADKLIRDFKLTPEQQQQWDEYKLQTANEYAKYLAADRDSARQREIQVKDSAPHRLAYMMIGAAIGLTAFQIGAYFLYPDVTSKIPGPAWSMIGGTTGYLFSEVKLILAYYFGGSLSGDESHAALQDLTRK